MYRQATIDQEGSTHSPLFFWDNTYPGVELLLSQLDAANAAHASTVRPCAPRASPTRSVGLRHQGGSLPFAAVLLGQDVPRC